MLHAGSWPSCCSCSAGALRGRTGRVQEAGLSPSLACVHNMCCCCLPASVCSCAGKCAPVLSCLHLWYMCWNSCQPMQPSQSSSTSQIRSSTSPRLGLCPSVWNTWLSPSGSILPSPLLSRTLKALLRSAASFLRAYRSRAAAEAMEKDMLGLCTSIGRLSGHSSRLPNESPAQLLQSQMKLALICSTVHICNVGRL